MGPASHISYQTVHHLYGREWSKNNVYLFIRLWFHYSARFLGTVEIPVHFLPRSSDLQTRLTAKWTLKPTDAASVINHLLAVSLMSMSLHHTAAHMTLTEHTRIYHAVRARMFFFGFFFFITCPVKRQWGKHVVRGNYGSVTWHAIILRGNAFEYVSCGLLGRGTVRLT